MKIAICEDNKSCRKSLINNILIYSKNNNLNIDIAEFEDGTEILNNFKQNEYNIIFLDIYMKSLDGIETARKIRDLDKACLIIFSTISEGHALDAYSVQAIDYLVKPITYKQLEYTLNRCIPMVSSQNKFIKVLSNRLTYKIPHKEILFIEVFNKVCLIHTTNDKIVKTYTPLSELENELGEGFLRCHRSYVINMNHIKEIIENDFVLNTDINIPIVKDKKNSIKQIYLDYLFEITRKNGL